MNTKLELTNREVKNMNYYDEIKNKIIDNEIYSKIIKDNIDGFLTNEIEWFEKLEYIYLNYFKLDNIISNACLKCHKLYDYDKQIDKIETIYDNIIQELGEK